MTDLSVRTWRDAHAEILRRIRARAWAPGDLIPKEVDLAAEMGVTRSTMNRALRELAAAGVVERRRKGGTRVAEAPVRKATLDIPVIRREVEAGGRAYGYTLLHREATPPPADIRARLALTGAAAVLHLIAVHLADGRPFVEEERWINPAGAAGALDVDFTAISANEWLIAHTPFSRGDIAFGAASASPDVAARLAIEVCEPLFVIERTTWGDEAAITFVRLSYPGGYRMRTTL
ncbi:MAG: GntR family transcriptional regulator [Pseudomonadota bacterium]